MKTQKCKICEEVKPLTGYYSREVKPKTKEPYTYYHKRCKECEIKKTTKRIYDNLNYWKEYWKERDKSPKRIQQKREHSERQRKSGYHKQWQRKNKDKVSQYAREREKIKTHEITEEQWKECKSYFDNSCAYCGISEEKHLSECNEQLHKEHVFHNGTNGVENCVPSCKSCNSRKWQHDFSDWYSKDNPIYSIERETKVINWLLKDHKNVAG